MRPKAGGIYRIGREAHTSAPGGEREPRDDAAKIAFLKSITLKALVLERGFRSAVIERRYSLQKKPGFISESGLFG